MLKKSLLFEPGSIAFPLILLALPVCATAADESQGGGYTYGDVSIGEQSGEEQPLGELGLVEVLGGQQDVAEVSTPQETLVESAGYFPTYEETQILSGDFMMEGPDYPRSYVGADNILGGSDTIRQGATGIWPYEVDDPDFFERNENVFRPIDNILGVFVPRDSLVLFQGDPTYNTSLAFDAGLPLTRRLERDMAHIKAGPVAFDLLSVSGTAIYSDLNTNRPTTNDDGFIAAIDLTARGYIRLTDQTYLAMAGTVYYLPTENEVGFYLNGNHSTFARINTEWEWGAWDFQVFDEFRLHHRTQDLLDPIEHDEIVSSGRYRLGRQGTNRSSDEYFDGDALSYMNVIGFRATAPVSQNFRFWSAYDHFDYWPSANFDERNEHDRVRLQLVHEGDWRIAPDLTYTLRSGDSFQSLYQSFELGATTILTPNIRLRGSAGYFWTSGSGFDEDEGALWNLGIMQSLGANTIHSLEVGNTFANNEFGDNFVASYARYTLTHRVTSRLDTGLWAQWSDIDYDGPTGTEARIVQTGLSGNYALGDYTRIGLRFAFQDSNYKSTALSDEERWIYRFELSRRLATRLTGTFTYQYEDFIQKTGGSDFDEHLFMLNVKRYF